MTLKNRVLHSACDVGELRCDERGYTAELPASEHPE